MHLHRHNKLNRNVFHWRVTSAFICKKCQTPKFISAAKKHPPNPRDKKLGKHSLINNQQLLAISWIVPSFSSMKGSKKTTGLADTLGLAHLFIIRVIHLHHLPLLDFGVCNVHLLAFNRISVVCIYRHIYQYT